MYPVNTIFDMMIWYVRPPQHLKVPSLLIAIFYLVVCLRVLRGRYPSRGEHVATPLKCASIPLGPLRCGQPPKFPQVTAYKHTFPGSRASAGTIYVLLTVQSCVPPIWAWFCLRDCDVGYDRLLGSRRNWGSTLHKCHSRYETSLWVTCVAPPIHHPLCAIMLYSWIICVHTHTHSYVHVSVNSTTRFSGTGLWIIAPADWFIMIHSSTEQSLNLVMNWCISLYWY